MMEIIQPGLILGGFGALFGVALSIASNIFHVEVDPKIEAVLDALPGANCGACGFPGCEGLAQAIAEGKAAVDSCPIGGQDTAEVVADIMGSDAGEMEKLVATVLCQGDKDKASNKYIYDGIQDCRVQAAVADGCKTCPHGCLGCGTCLEVCDFGAIEIINGIAVIDRDKCTSCGICIDVCPKEMIKLVPYDNNYVVKCNSTEAGRAVRQSCEIGCIGCSLCVRNCPEEAISMENGLAVIDYDKCTNCGICAEKCPTKCIDIVGDLEEDKLEKIN